MAKKNDLAMAKPVSPAELVKIQQRFDEQSGLLKSFDLNHRFRHWSPELEGQTHGEIKGLLVGAAMTMVELGARFWLLREKAQYGEWQSYLHEHYPEVPERTVRRWMLLFRRAAGLAGPATAKKMLTFDDLGEEEEAANQLLSDPKAAVKTYGELAEENARLKKQVEKGKDQSRVKDDQIEQLRAQVERANKSLHIPEDIHDEEARVELIRNAWWHYYRVAVENLPATRERLLVHRALCDELASLQQEMWEEHLLPRAEEKILGPDAKK